MKKLKKSKTVKPLFPILILVAGLLSCKEDTFLPLTPELVEEIFTYDLDNNGNSSDIRVDFEIVNNLNVVGTTLSNYTWDWSSHICSNSNCNVGIELCPRFEQGDEGTILDELILKIAFIYKDCISTCTGARIFVRQG